APELRVLVEHLARGVGPPEVRRDDPVLRRARPFALLARLGVARGRAAPLLARVLGALPAVVAGHAVPPRWWDSGGSTRSVRLEAGRGPAETDAAKGGGPVHRAFDGSSAVFGTVRRTADVRPHCRAQRRARASGARPGRSLPPPYRVRSPAAASPAAIARRATSPRPEGAAATRRPPSSAASPASPPTARRRR